ncbi:MAG: hypothetical protein NZ518_07990, partial [Dehalococcoidia bacterium]|nr:hypothetical protein [Dehalococcoidia bacterium]
VTVDFPFNATAGNARSHKETVEYLQVALRPLGFDIRPIAVESGVLTDMVNRGEWNLRLTNGHGWANGDPDFRLRTFMHSRGSANTTQQGSYRNEMVDRLIDQGVAEADRARRFAIYERLQEIAVEEAPVMCVYDELSPYAYRATIRDLRQRVTYQPTLETMNVG